jgi:hypothetical protein
MMSTTITRRDYKGRVWEYNDCEGSWRHGKHIVGCGLKNGRKWQIWNGPQSSNVEHKTLSDAMSSCY